MGDAADGYLGDWLPHKDNCRCEECSRKREIKRLSAHIDAQAEAIKGLRDLSTRLLYMVCSSPNCLDESHREFYDSLSKWGNK